MANEFFTILTTVGMGKLAAAQASGTPLQLTQMAVGDGNNGAYYNPVESQTALKHETWRGALNNLSTDVSNPNWIVAELVIPDTVGGFYIREVGLLDNTGALIAVGKFPESYKPTLATGSNKQLYVRMILEVSNASAVTLLVDPSVVLATRATVDLRIAEELARLDGKPSVKVATTAAIALTGLQTVDGISLAAGDRVLVKDQVAAKDNGIYVIAAGGWVRAADADASIEVTPGLFVTVEQGASNADSIWQLVTDGPITLGATGLAFEMVNGKTGVVAGTYRSVTVNQRGQIVGGTNPTTLAGYGITDAGGLPLLFPLWCPNRAAIPAGYAPADGQMLARSLYPDAWAGIAAGNVPAATDAAWLATPTERGKFTAGDGVGTFRLPDYNGKSAGSLGALFLRGDGTLSAQTNGVIQPDELREHDHPLNVATGADTTRVGLLNQVGGVGPAGAGGARTYKAGGAETRPMNVTGCWVIRLFGAAVNPGAADAAQLATEVSKLGADKVPFAAFLGANQSQAVIGYQKLPGGLILQWGQTVANATAGQPVTITLPIANLAATRSITITRTGGSVGADFNTFSVSDITTTNFVVRAQVSGSPTFFWMAIGH